MPPGASGFGPIHVLEPTLVHTHTAIMLHGRGSNGEEFAEELLSSSHLPSRTSLAESLPHYRWVFPSSQILWSSAFEELLPAWFEAHSLTNITERRHLQTKGISDSVEYIQGIMQDEIEKLGGRSENLLLGGISQGGAIALWTLLTRSPALNIGACVASNTWLPLSTNLHRVLISKEKSNDSDKEFDHFVDCMMLQHLSSRLQGERVVTPVFLGHGADDAYVDVTLGRDAAATLTGIGFHVQWNEYSGAEQEGHWFKVPEQMDDIYNFIIRNISDNPFNR